MPYGLGRLVLRIGIEIWQCIAECNIQHIAHMGNRKIPTISGGEPSLDLFEGADLLNTGDDRVIDLHGMNRDDAARALDLFLDRAVRGRVTAVKIIHGKGTGALADLLRNTLSRDKRVKTFKASDRQLGAAMLVVLK